METFDKLDLTYLKEISKGDTDFELMMLKFFIEQTGEELEKIIQSADEKNWNVLRAALHKIKPSFHFIGAHKTDKVIVSLEEHLKEVTEPDKIKTEVKQFAEHCKHNVEMVKQEIEKQKEPVNV